MSYQISNDKTNLKRFSKADLVRISAKQNKERFIDAPLDVKTGSETLVISLFIFLLKTLSFCSGYMSFLAAALISSLRLARQVLDKTRKKKDKLFSFLAWEKYRQDAVRKKMPTSF